MNAILDLIKMGQTKCEYTLLMISMDAPVVYFNLFLIICFVTVCLQGLKLTCSVIFRCAVNRSSMWYVCGKSLVLFCIL